MLYEEITNVATYLVVEVERSLFSSSDEDDLEETRESLQKEWEIISEIEKVEEELARVNKQMIYEHYSRQRTLKRKLQNLKGIIYFQNLQILMRIEAKSCDFITI